jgi:hypothetical protein
MVDIQNLSTRDIELLTDVVGGVYKCFADTGDMKSCALSDLFRPITQKILKYLYDVQCDLDLSDEELNKVNSWFLDGVHKYDNFKSFDNFGKLLVEGFTAGRPEAAAYLKHFDAQNACFTHEVYFNCMIAACEHGHLELAKYLHTACIGNRMFKPILVHVAACRSRNLEMFQWSTAQFTHGSKKLKYKGLVHALKTGCMSIILTYIGDVKFDILCRKYFYEVCMNACNLEIAQYIYLNVGITKEIYDITLSDLMFDCDNPNIIDWMMTLPYFDDAARSTTFIDAIRSDNIKRTHLIYDKYPNQCNLALGLDNAYDTHSVPCIEFIITLILAGENGINTLAKLIDKL